jgi:hypothetical protein
MDGYTLTDNANEKEIGLIHSLPCKTLCLKRKNISGAKLCKGRLTVYLSGFFYWRDRKTIGYRWNH